MYYFIISHLWLTSHLRSAVVLSAAVTLGTSRGDTVRMQILRLGTLIRNRVIWPFELNSSKANAGKELKTILPFVTVQL